MNTRKPTTWSISRLCHDNRVTDETAPVNIVAPGDPLVTFPNEVTSAAWKGWVQERGLHFLA